MTGATLTVHHFGAREVALTDIKHNITRVCAKFKAAFKHFHKITNSQECNFTEAAKEAGRTPASAFHLVGKEENRENAHSKTEHSKTDFRGS